MFHPVHLKLETWSIRNQDLNKPNETSLTTEGERQGGEGGKNKDERENYNSFKKQTNIELEEEKQTFAGRQKVRDKKGNYINGGS